MARTKISKVAKDFNISVQTAVEFLRKKNITIDDNPNARIDDDAYDMLAREFQPDQALKTRSERQAADRQKEKVVTPAAPKEAQANEEVEIKVTHPSAPRVLGRIDLTTGKPIEEPKEESKPAEAPKAESKPVETPVAKPQPETKPEQLKEPVKPVETPKAPEPKEAPVAKEKAPEKPQPAPAAEKLQPAPAAEKAPSAAPSPAPKAEARPKEQPASTDSKPKEEAVFTTATTIQGPTLNIVGKIDLDAINQTTRPKKKSKDQRKSGDAAAAGERHKRKRIGGREKVDIERHGQNQQGGGGNGGGERRNGNQQGGNRRGNDRKNENKRPQHTEIKEEDVQKQVKDTLARLTNKDKGQKKGAKWRKEKREAFANREREAAQLEAAENKVLKLTEFVTANDLASMMDVPINNIIATCMNLGVMVSINQRLDAETINIVAEEFGFKTEYVSAEVVEAIHQEEDKEEDLETRPPIVTVMGHVDHGKTSLLDYIRNANVIAGEAGGITQHIGAYNVKLSDGRHITFLDTPGHEAFTAMRARGAELTDVAILVVAADDGVMPQTVEAINHAQAANVPIVVAVNKIDKPGANPDKVRGQLTEYGLVPEEYGGNTMFVDISAKQGTNVDKLLEAVLLTADAELDLRANPDMDARGATVEARLDKGRGAVATVLVQSGTLHIGDSIVAGTSYGRVRAMLDENGTHMKEATPSTPVQVLGLTSVPTAGDLFLVASDDRTARQIAEKRQATERAAQLAKRRKVVSLESLKEQFAKAEVDMLNIVIKGDSSGSVEALEDSLMKIEVSDEVGIQVIHRGVGAITQNDVNLATVDKAVIIGFNVRPNRQVADMAEREGVEIKYYSIIYKAIEDIEASLKGMLKPEFEEVVTSHSEIREIFRSSKFGNIAGVMVQDGEVKRGTKCRILRNGIATVNDLEISSLRRFKDDVNSVKEGYEAGINLGSFNDIELGDIIETFEMQEIERK